MNAGGHEKKIIWKFDLFVILLYLLLLFLYSPLLLVHLCVHLWSIPTTHATLFLPIFDWQIIFARTHSNSEANWLSRNKRINSQRWIELLGIIAMILFSRILILLLLLCKPIPRPGLSFAWDFALRQNWGHFVIMLAASFNRALTLPEAGVLNTFFWHKSKFKTSYIPINIKKNIGFALYVTVWKFVSNVVIQQIQVIETSKNILKIPLWQCL